MKLITPKIQIITLFIFVTYLLNAQYSEIIIKPEYLFKEFKTGNVYLQNQPIQTAPMNYNTLTQEMLFKRDSTILKLTNLYEVDSVVIENRVFIPHGAIFYEIIAGTQLKLLLQNKARWDTEGAVSGYGRSKLASSKDVNIISTGGQVKLLNPDVPIEVFDNSVYLIFANNMLLPASTIKNYITLFPEHEKEIKAIAKKNKLNLKNKIDRQKFVLLINKFLNEL